MNEYGFDTVDDSYAGIIREMVVDFVKSGWHVAALTWWLGWMLLALALSYPMVLPGGAVASPVSWLALLVSALLVVTCGMAARALVGCIPVTLAVAACVCVPVGVIIVGLLWCVPACAAAIAVALVVGVLVFIARRRMGGTGALVPLCVSVCVATAGLLVTLTVGGSLCLRCPEVLSAGYARVDDGEGHGPLADVAEDLASTVADADAGHACDGVVVAPFFTGVDGVLMSWGKGPSGEPLMLVSSEFLGSYSKAELEDLARNMLDENPDTAMLCTRWIDGILWTEGCGC